MDSRERESLEPHGFSVLDYIVPPTKKLSREEKFLEAANSLIQEGRPATPEHVMQRVKELFPSRLNIPFLPLWERTVSNLENRGEYNPNIKRE